MLRIVVKSSSGLCTALLMALIPLACSDSWPDPDPADGGTVSFGGGPGVGGHAPTGGGPGGRQSIGGTVESGGTPAGGEGGAQGGALGGGGGSGTHDCGSGALGGAGASGNVGGAAGTATAGESAGGSAPIGDSGAGGTEPNPAGGEAGDSQEPTPDVEHVTWLGGCGPGRLSDDGTTVLSYGGLWNEALGWTSLPVGPKAMSGDGRVVYGSDDGYTHFYRWTYETGISWLDLDPPLYTFATNVDGSVLVGCARVAVGDNWDEPMYRFTPAGGLVQLLQGPWLGCGGRVLLSNDGLLVANGGDGVSVDLHRIEDGRLLFVRTVLPDRFIMSLTAMSRDGNHVGAFEQAGGSYWSVPACLWGGNPNPNPLYPLDGCDDNHWVLDYDEHGEAAVGIDLPGNQGSRYPLGTFHWSRAEGINFLADRLFEHGVYVDPWRFSEPRLSADGQTILGGATRHFPDGSASDECFLARLQPAKGVDLTAGDGLTASALSVGRAGACAVQSDGQLACWGEDARDLVAGHVGATWSPVLVPGLSDVTQVATHTSHHCAVLRNGSVRCWGLNTHGQLGNGTRMDSAIPVEVTGITNAVALSVYDQSTCAVLSDGHVRCWGDNANGQIGDGTREDSAVPVEVSGLDHVTSVAHFDGLCGLTPMSVEPCYDFGNFQPGTRFEAVCAQRDDHTLWCWGAMNDEGLDLPASSVPVLVERVPEVLQVSVGDYTICFLQSNATAHCFGFPPRELLGEFEVWTPLPGSMSLTSTSLLDDESWWRSNEVPYQHVVSLPPGTVEIANGFRGLCARIDDGTVQCKGWDVSGALGRGFRDSQGTEFLPVLGVHDAQHIGMGNENTCALLASGAVACWGRGDVGQLGNGHVYTNFPYGLARPGRVRTASAPPP